MHPREARLGRRCDRAGVRGRERAEVGAVRRRREGCERAGVEGLCGGLGDASVRDGRFLRRLEGASWRGSEQGVKSM